MSCGHLHTRNLHRAILFEDLHGKLAVNRDAFPDPWAQTSEQDGDNTAGAGYRLSDRSSRAVEGG
jgi:hypothetical protein